MDAAQQTREHLESLDKYLQHLREKAGLRPPEVIDHLQVSRFTFYSWERPGSRPDPVALGRLLDLYEASPAERLVAFELRALPS